MSAKDDKNNEVALNGRRNFLKKSLALIPISVAAGSGVLTATQPAQADQSVTRHYVPTFFNEDEWAFLEAACERLIPSDNNGPGAVEEGVLIYLDKQMASPYGHGGLWYMHPPFVQAVPELGYQLPLTPRDIYRLGIRAVNAYCQKTFSKPFAQLSPQQQDTVLHELQNGKHEFDDISGSLFFTTLLQNTKEGYLADPIHGGNQTLASWKLIGFPGARADFTDWAKRPGQRYPLAPVSISSKRNA